MYKVSNFQFDDTEVAFRDRSDAELKRMYFLFWTMNSPWMTKAGVWATKVALKIHLPIRFLVRKTIFAQFCGGVSLDDSMVTVDKLVSSNIHTILDYSVEGESEESTFDHNKTEIMKSLDLAKNSDSIPIAVMKLTGFVDFDLLVQKQEGKLFSQGESEQWERFLARIHEICQRAVELDKAVFIDAEESWIQKAVDEVVNALMNQYNRSRVYVYNTYQMYKKDSLENLKKEIKNAKTGGFKIGAKLVRGAYMEKERQRAGEFKYEDPIYPSKFDTDRAYDKAVELCMRNIDCMSICAGTHNEFSSHYLTELMEERQMCTDDHRIYFAQLYGMSDNISYQLAGENYNVAKYVPYGPVEKVLPYLMRRAEENTSITGQSSREFTLVKKEMRRRKTKNYS